MAELLEKEKRKADQKKRDRQASKDEEILSNRRKKKKAEGRKLSATNKGKAPVKKKKPTSAGVFLPCDDMSEGSDMDFDPAVWEVVSHAVDAHGGKPKFKAICGRRKNGKDKFFWAERNLLVEDGIVGLDEYIQERCEEEVFTDLLVPVAPVEDTTKREASRLAAVIPSKQVISKQDVLSKRDPCNHGIYQDQITYEPESNPGFCRTGYYLSGLKCGNGCGNAFVPANNKVDNVVAPSSNAPVYCCKNIAGRNGKSQEEMECSHVVCFECWKKGVLTQFDAPRGRRSSTSRG